MTQSRSHPSREACFESAVAASGGVASEIIADPRAFASLLRALKVDSADGEFSHRVSSIMSRFARGRRSVLTRYFDGGATLPETTREFVRFIFQERLQGHIGRDLVMKSPLGAPMVEHSDFAVKAILSGRRFPETLSILGFGLGDGEWECRLGEFLVEGGVARNAAIYGYDPFAVRARGIKYLDDEQIRSSMGPRFDLILARWTLHHVDDAERWRGFAAALSRLNDGGIAIAVEHGFIARPNVFRHEHLYRLMNAVLDVIANLGFYPRWFTATKSDPGRRFHVDFLKDGDVKAIGVLSKRRLASSISTVGPIFPWQTIITFRARGAAA